MMQRLTTRIYGNQPSNKRGLWSIINRPCKDLKNIVDHVFFLLKVITIDFKKNQSCCKIMVRYILNYLPGRCMSSLLLQKHLFESFHCRRVIS